MLISDIIPYERNARHNERAIPKVAESIREFGLRGTIGLESRENPVIVFGHTRVAACKSLGWTEIPDSKIEFCDDLTPDQVKAFRIADNKTGDIATYNKSMLREEVRSLKDFDMARFGVDFKSKGLDYGAERLKTDRAYNLDLVNRFGCARDGFPPLPLADVEGPRELQGFNYAKTTKAADKADLGCHFFIDDYQFERLWQRPAHYLDVLRPYQCVLTPDFSLYMDMPDAMQQWNRYRSYKFCFKGIPRHSTVATSTVGVARDKEAQEVWNDGMREAMRRLEPSRVLLYGKNVGFDFGGCEVVEYEAGGFHGR